MTEDYKQKIENILNKKNSKNRISINQLGRYYLIEELNKLKYISELKGWYCFITTNKNKNLKIKVRASTFKDEKLFKIDKKYIKFWGWVIEMKGKEKENFDFFICVSLDDSWKKPKFYIFSYDEVNSIENCNKNIKWRYRTVKKALKIFESPEIMEEAFNIRPELIVNKEKEINKNLSLYENAWYKIK